MDKNFIFYIIGYSAWTLICLSVQTGTHQLLRFSVLLGRRVHDVFTGANIVEPPPSIYPCFILILYQMYLTSLASSLRLNNIQIIYSIHICSPRHALLCFTWWVPSPFHLYHSFFSSSVCHRCNFHLCLGGHGPSSLDESHHRIIKDWIATFPPARLSTGGRNISERTSNKMLVALGSWVNR